MEEKVEAKLNTGIYEKFANIEGWVGSLVFIVMCVAASLGVLFRYFFNYSLSWTDEASRYGFVWMGFMAMAYATIYRRHIVIDLLSAYFWKKHPLFVLLMRWIGKWLWTAFTVFFIYKGSTYCLKSIQGGEKTASLYIPFAVVYAALPIAFSFMLYWLIKQLIEDYKVIRKSCK